MSSCVNCGKTLTFMNETYPLWDEAKEKLCSKCRNKIVSFVDSSNTSVEEFEKNKSNFIKMGFTQQGLEYIRNYCEYEDEKRKKRFEESERQRKYDEEKELRNKEKEERIRALHIYDYDNHLMTTGYNFEGYAIKKYIRIISGEVVLGTGFLSEFTASFSDFLGSESNSFANKLEEAKQAATKKLIRQSLANGGNAIIGVDFDYINFAGNMIGVVANGTCVWVEKND